MAGTVRDLSHATVVSILAPMQGAHADFVNKIIMSLECPFVVVDLIESHCLVQVIVTRDIVV